MRLLVVNEQGDWPLAVREMIGVHGIKPLGVPSCRKACDPELLSQVDAVLVCEPPDDLDAEAWQKDLQLLADALASQRLTGIRLSPDTAGVASGDDHALMVTPADASAEELWGRVATIRQYRPFLLQLDQQVAAMQRLGKKLNQQFVEVDQELRLASRLQRDFLPRSFPQLGEIRFGAMYRPAAWVSGDMYDVFRIDENHVGCYLADAVGHGIAAGLLTMFIKQAVIGKRIHQGGYTIVPPAEVLASLNAELARQELPNCQFVTACYALIDTQTNEITFSRAGHPHPIHVSANGECAEVRTIGGLLGVFPEETFVSARLELMPGEKLLLYSDGLEDKIIAGRNRQQGQVQFTPEFRELARQPLTVCLRSLGARLDGLEGSLQPLDDVTLVGIEHLG